LGDAAGDALRKVVANAIFVGEEDKLRWKFSGSENLQVKYFYSKYPQKQNPM
jgi:hypothetical protein